MVSTSSATPPPSPAGLSGTSGASGTSGSSQLPPPPPLSTNQGDQSKSTAAPSSSKIAVSAENTAWTTTDTRLKPSVSSITKDLHMDDVHWWKPLSEEDRPATPEPAWSIPSSDLPVLMNNWASALASTYAPPPENSLLAHTGDMTIFMDCTKHEDAITTTDKVDDAILRDKYGVLMIMWFNEIHKFSDDTLQQIDEVLDYRVKEFKVNRMNPGLNTRFWTRKDVDRSKEFMFAIQK
ncbi:hypothetical protein Tco_0218292 [Tanacetum coccineum]